MKQWRRRQAGFTLIEIVVVIAVIAILATIATLGLGVFQADGRDRARNAATITLSESLEKYYDENGEYPSCAMMTGSASSVQDLLGVSADALTLPQSTSDNAIVCADISPSTPGDVIAYVGDSSTQCSTGLACLSYTLKYVEEGSGEVQSIGSRRTAAVAVVPTAPASTTTASLSGGTASAQATDVVCTSSTPEYRVDLQVNDGSWSAGSWGPDRTRSTSASQGSQYGFRTLTRCVLSDGSQGSATTGNTDEVVRDISAPSAPVLTASSSGTGTADTVTWSWAGVSCPNGTNARYSRAYYRDDSTAWRNWSSDVTSTSYSVSTNYEGYQYRAKARARCVSSYAQSNYSSDSNEPAYIRAVDKPSLATNFQAAYYDGAHNVANGYGSITQSGRWVGMRWTAPSCGPGTTPYRKAVTATATADGGGLFVDIWNNTYGIVPAGEIGPRSKAQWQTNPFPVNLLRWPGVGLTNNPNTNNISPTSNDISNAMTYGEGLPAKSLGNGWNPPSVATQSSSRAIVVYACFNAETLRKGYYGNYSISSWVNY